MTLGLSEHRAPRPGVHRAARVAHWGVLALALVDCRAPPPIARTPDDPPAARALVPDPPPDPAPAPAPVSSEPEPPAPPPADFSGEQRELAERYGRHRSQGVLRGEASYYGAAFAGRKTASGEIFEPKKYTAAHRTLPFGTVLRVTRLDTKAVVYVRVNDRGPFGKKHRILDLSTAAAETLGMLRRGIANGRADIVERAPPRPAKKKRRARRAN
jgi:rare lipoprotein A